MGTKRFFFAMFVAFCLLLSCLVGSAVAQGGPGGGGGGNGGGGGGGGGNGGGGGGNPGISLASQLADVWQAGPTTNTFVKMTLNTNGSYTLTDSITNTGITTATTTQGNWTLGPATNPQPFSNPQGFLTLISKGQILLSGNVLLIKPDLFEIVPTINNISSFVPFIVFAKATP